MTGPTLWSTSLSWICAETFSLSLPHTHTQNTRLTHTHKTNRCHLSMHSANYQAAYTPFHQKPPTLMETVEHWSVRPKYIKCRNHACTVGLCSLYQDDIKMMKPIYIFEFNFLSFFLCLFGGLHVFSYMQS